MSNLRAQLEAGAAFAARYAPGTHPRYGVTLGVEIDGIHVSVFGKHSSFHYRISYDGLETTEGNNLIQTAIKEGIKQVGI